MAHRRQPQLPYDPPLAGPTFDVAYLEALAQRVVELIRSEGGTRVGCRLVDAATLASELGVERSWVYAHRGELGAIQLGTGAKPRLRFDVAAAREALSRTADDASRAAKTPRPVSKPTPRRRRRAGSNSGLLPIRGSATALNTHRESS
jgi:hypothetical protein